MVIVIRKHGDTPGSSSFNAHTSERIIDAAMVPGGWSWSGRSMENHGIYGIFSRNLLPEMVLTKTLRTGKSHLFHGKIYELSMVIFHSHYHFGSRFLRSFSQGLASWHGGWLRASSLSNGWIPYHHWIYWVGSLAMSLLLVGTIAMI